MKFETKRILDSLQSKFRCHACGERFTFLETVGKRECKNRHKYGIERGSDGIARFTCCNKPDTMGNGCVCSDHTPSQVEQTIKIQMYFVEQKLIKLTKEIVELDQNHYEYLPNGQINFEKSFYVVRIYDPK